MSNSCHKSNYEIQHHCDIEGHVVDYYTGQAYPNVNVVLDYEYVKTDYSIGWLSQVTTTNNDGYFIFKNHGFQASAPNIRLSANNNYNILPVFDDLILNRSNKKINTTVYASCGGKINLKVKTGALSFYFIDFNNGGAIFFDVGANGTYNCMKSYFGSGIDQTQIIASMYNSQYQIIYTKTLNIGPTPCYQTLNDSITFP